MCSVLERHGIIGTLTGGSAASVYAQGGYTSLDADFIVPHDVSLSQIATALAAIGFARLGKSRIFSHPETDFTLDFPKGPLAVGGDYVHTVDVLQRDGMNLRILTRTDCVRDRLSHYYYWNDFTALNAAVAVATHGLNEIDMEFLRRWTVRESRGLLSKFEEFERRLHKARR